MRIATRLMLAIRTAPLLAVVPMAVLFPGADAYVSQTGTGTVQQVPLFTAIDLTPPGFTSAQASGISGGEQVGGGYGPATGGDYRYNHALLWRGSASSVVDLNPKGFDSSSASATCGGQQVGKGSGPATGHDHALLWRGSADSVVDLNPGEVAESGASGVCDDQQVGVIWVPEGQAAILHAALWHGRATRMVDLNPRGFESVALGVSEGQQVGWGIGPTTRGQGHNALLWRGTAASVVDLHPRGFAESEAHGTSGAEQVGWGSTGDCIPGIGPAPGRRCWRHALLWRGSAASMVDLNPPGFAYSEAFRTCRGEQVGRGSREVGDNGWGPSHALLWRGSAASIVDLHTFLPSDFVESVASGIDAAGDIVGYASRASTGSTPPNFHAYLWRRIPGPNTTRAQNTMRC